jgi:hypothetical protein
MSSDFEDRVRERLHDAVATLPRDTTLTTRIMDATVEAPPRRHRTRSALHTWMPPLVAGAASVAVVVAVVVLATRTRPTGHARPTPGASTSVSVAPTSPPPAKTSSQPTSGTSSPTSPVAPSAADISRILTHTVETASPSTHFGDPSAPVTTGDGHGGTLTAVIAHRTPAADSHGYLVFFWHNNQFVGWDRNQEAMTTKAVTAAGPGAFSVTYANYAGNDPACCPSLAPVTITYHWNGTRLQADQPVPPGVYGLSNPTATPVTVQLR